MIMARCCGTPPLGLGSASKQLGECIRWGPLQNVAHFQQFSRRGTKANRSLVSRRCCTALRFRAYVIAFAIFHVIAFAIFAPGYGPDNNFDMFEKEFKEV